MRHSVFALCLALSQPAVAQDSGAAIVAAFTGLPPVPQLIEPSCAKDATADLDNPGAVADALGRLLRSPDTNYVIAFDRAAAQRSADLLQASVDASDQAALLEDMLPAITGEAFYDIRGYLEEDIGLSPDLALDLAAIYLVFLWMAQSGDPTMLDTPEPTRILRDQIALSEASCGTLSAALGEVPELPSLLIVHTGLLAETMEEVGNTVDHDLYQGFLARAFGHHFGGLTFTRDSGLQ